MYNPSQEWHGNCITTKQKTWLELNTMVSRTKPGNPHPLPGEHCQHSKSVKKCSGFNVTASTCFKIWTTTSQQWQPYASTNPPSSSNGAVPAKLPGSVKLNSKKWHKDIARSHTDIKTILNMNSKNHPNSKVWSTPIGYITTASQATCTGDGTSSTGHHSPTADKVASDSSMWHEAHQISMTRNQWSQW